eukprot:CFRG5332T1
MSFAQSQLNKYGWKEGEGLGREKQGNSKAIRAELKRDSAGLGHGGDDFGFNWWDHCYNKAASKIEVSVCDKSGSVSVKTVKTDVKTTLGVRAAPASMLYGSFVSAKGDNAESSDDESKDYSTLSKLTSEEIYKACGGRTAHKGARHGIRQVAKLKRAKEDSLMTSLESQNSSVEAQSDSDSDADSPDSGAGSVTTLPIEVSPEKVKKERKKEKKSKSEKTRTSSSSKKSKGKDKETNGKDTKPKSSKKEKNVKKDKTETVGKKNRKRRAEDNKDVNERQAKKKRKKEKKE